MTVHLLPPNPEAVTASLGKDLDAKMTHAAAWYFQNEWVGVDAVRKPSLPFWLSAPHRQSQWRLDLDKKTVSVDERNEAFSLYPALDSNPTYINDHTLQFYSKRLISGRYERSALGVQLRTLWPEDWRFMESQAKPVTRWQEVIAHGVHGAQKPFECYTVWQHKQPETPRFFLGFILNGAQGDDDEAHGGHLALVFGDWQKNGDLSQLWVANFYNPDVVSEKGILPAITTMDNYLTDLNCGQQHYRPSWMIGCTLTDALPVERIYAALNDTMNALYSHAFVYQHTTNNCTGLTMDALRYAGLNVPMKGPSSRVLAPLLFLYKLIQEKEWAAAKSAFQYFNAERTRLLPYVGFKHSVVHVMRLLHGKMLPTSELEMALVTGTCSVLGFHFPQIPSARAFGREPVSSVFQYQNRVPAKRKDWKIIPVPPRPFPEHLRNA